MQESNTKSKTIQQFNFKSGGFTSKQKEYRLIFKSESTIEAKFGISPHRLDLDMNAEAMIESIKIKFADKPDVLEKQLKSIPYIKSSLWTNEQLADFQKLLEKTISNWKEEYLNLDIVDGTQWRLEVEYNDGSIKRVNGSNKFPENWDEFKQLLESFFEKNKSNM